MKVEYGRRSSIDPEWQKCKAIVYARDNNRCQFYKCLTATEAYSISGDRTQHEVDPAHIFAASHNPDLIYEPKNVILLERWVHRRMDNYQSPITGLSIDLNEHYYWWYRIFKRMYVQYDESVDYKDILYGEINDNDNCD